MTQKMFPTSLHKNIRELDKQISLLETECENMEADKKKTRTGSRTSQSKGKFQKSLPQSPPVKELSKKPEKPYITGPSRSLTTSSTRKHCVPPVLHKMHSTTSVPCKEGHEFVNVEDSPPTEVILPGAKLSSSQTNFILNGGYPSTGDACLRKGRSSQSQTQYICEDSRPVIISESEKEDYPESPRHLLHREVLYTKPGSTIEVTFKQKCNKTDLNKCNELSCKRSISSIREVSESSSERGETIKVSENTENKKFLNNKSGKSPNPKWADILFQESELEGNKKTKRKKSKSELSTADVKDVKNVNEELYQGPQVYKLQCFRAKTCPSNNNNSTNTLNTCTTPTNNGGKLSADNESRHSSCFKENIKVDTLALKEKWLNDNNLHVRPRTPPTPTKKTRSPRTKKKLDHDVIVRKREEKETQCLLWSEEPKKSELPLDLYSPVRAMNFLIGEMKEKPMDKEASKLLEDMEANLQKICGDRLEKSYNSSIHPFHNKEENFDPFGDKDNDYVVHLRRSYMNSKKFCEKLNKEKERLKEELAAKDRLITTMNSKEKEHIMTISNLKANLDAAKQQAEESTRVLKEYGSMRNKFAEEKKVSEALRKTHTKMQERIQKCLLENDKLKTQIRMNKLETQKLNVLLAGKDVEIKRYREEVESFQKQVSDQLAVLRSNAAVNEVEKAMEAIIHHSQVFSQTDLDSVTSDTRVEKRRPPRNRSSTPTRARDKLTHSSPTSSKFSAVNSSWNKISSIYADDAGQKDLIVLSSLHVTNMKDSVENFGVPENSGYDGGSSKASPNSIVYKQPFQDMVNSINNSSFTSCRSVMDFENIDNVICEKSNSTVNKGSEDCMAAIAANTQRLRDNIEELFQDMKFRCTERIYSSPPENLKYEDMFAISPVSNLSEETNEVEDTSLIMSEPESVKKA